MTNWRVIEQRDADGMPCFTVADVAYMSPRYGMSPFIKHVPPYPVETTLDNLRDRLTEIISALDKPPLVFTASVLREKCPANPPQ